MEGLMKLLERVLDELQEVKDELKNVREILMRVERRWEVERSGGVGELSLRDLTEGEVRVAGVFLRWMKENEEAWEQAFKATGEEGYDRVVGLCYVRKGRMEDFINRLVGKGYLRKDILRVLGDLGLLRYRVKAGGTRQYCIRVSWKHNGMRKEGSRYVVNWGRVEELYKELWGLIQERRGVASEEFKEERGEAEAV